MMSRYVDLYGRRVVNTPNKSPYSYDPFVVYKGKDFSFDDDMFYSDRVYMWYGEKERELKKKHNIEHGDYYWAYNDIKKLDKFLCELMDKNLKITAIVQYCNVSNGYPYWAVYFKEGSEDVSR